MPEYVDALTTSPWLYLVVALLVAADGIVPVLPSEFVVLTLAAYAATGLPDTAGLVAAATVGGVAGDAAAYLLGRNAVNPARLARGPVRRLLRWGRRPMARYGALTVIVGRFLPGGRTASTLLAAALHYPTRRFFLVSTIAATLWAGYITVLGRLGSAVAANHPLFRIVPGIVLAVTVAGALSLVERHLRRRVRPAAVDPLGSVDPDLVDPLESVDPADRRTVSRRP
ncbi:DedA family protein [Plantactinospora sp. GCM10030261]|uniref:DedA family protein n=1 Tax=Plantactinospora sp. GCM10030261 TaxID=3273420 RepID=UPI00360A603A